MSIDEITKEVAKSFSCFGKGSNPQSNPLSVALERKPPTFALGVDVREVVLFVLERAGIGNN